jgi:tRNA dimethylallyltransferase
MERESPVPETIPVFVLFGPTASGKTDILLRLFGEGSPDRVCPAEVVSADSMQVYRGMDIGTAKPSSAERRRLPHHLIDIRSPAEQFTAGDFVRLADDACLDIARRGKLPVVSGGAGFYLKNFILGLPEAPPADGEIRAKLKEELAEKGAAALMSELAAGDRESAEKIHINDEYRLLRALEVLRITGRPLSSFGLSGKGAAKRPLYRFLVTGLSRPREELYQRINRRCAAMFRSGLPAEVRALCEAGYGPRHPGLRAIGYREFFVEEPGAEGEGSRRLSADIAGVEALTAQNSRRYAKRQITFFASIPEVKWIEAGAEEGETAGVIGETIREFYRRKTRRSGV